MDLLKSATALQHHDAERRRLQQELAGGRLPAPKYAQWLGQMLLVHQALTREIENRLAECPALSDVVRDAGGHVVNLRRDLVLLGVDPDGVAPLASTARATAAIRDAAAADALALLGFNYVLEGSMNGNRFIARALVRSLPVPAVGYLDPYGDDQRATWLAYRERMNAAGFDARQADILVSAARDMFRFVADISDELMVEAHTA
jgi:heme oxygenase